MMDGSGACGGCLRIKRECVLDIRLAFILATENGPLGPLAGAASGRSMGQ